MAKQLSTATIPLCFGFFRLRSFTVQMSIQGHWGCPSRKIWTRQSSFLSSNWLFRVRASVHWLTDGNNWAYCTKRTTVRPGFQAISQQYAAHVQQRSYSIRFMQSLPLARQNWANKRKALLVGCAARFFKSWPYFRRENVIFQTRFQTLLLKSIQIFRLFLCHHYLHWRANRFLKIHFEFAWYFFFSYSFGIQTTN